MDLWEGIVIVFIAGSAGIECKVYQASTYCWHNYMLLRPYMVPLLAGIEYRYSSKDSKWVIEKFLPKVEYGGELHVCLHDQDWLGRLAIGNSIIDSIEESQTTVLVLLNNFARS